MSKIERLEESLRFIKSRKYPKALVRVDDLEQLLAVVRAAQEMPWEDYDYGPLRTALSALEAKDV